MVNHYDRDHERESDETPFQWINRAWGAGQNAHIRVWIERDVQASSERWTVRKEEVDDSRRGQHKPTNLSDHSAKVAARKAAVEWMQSH